MVVFDGMSTICTTSSSSSIIFFGDRRRRRLVDVCARGYQDDGDDDDAMCATRNYVVAHRDSSAVVTLIYCSDGRDPRALPLPLLLYRCIVLSTIQRQYYSIRGVVGHHGALGIKQ